LCVLPDGAHPPADWLRNGNSANDRATRVEYPAMPLQEAKSIAHHLGLTLRRVRSGAYRVNFSDGNETTAYYTDNLEEAINTAVEMARSGSWWCRTERKL